MIRESVRAVAQELMEAEVSELIGAGHGERTEDRATHRNGYRPQALGHAGGRDRVADPQAPSGQLLPELPAAAQALRAGAGDGGPAGLCLRRLDAPGRSARREPRAADLARPRSAGSPGCSTSRSRRSASGRWRAATRICSSTRRSRRSATAAAFSASASSSRTPSMRPAGARSSAWTSAPRRPRRSGASSCAASSRAAWSASSWPSATRTRA